MTSNQAFEPTAASGLRTLAVSSLLRASAAAQPEREPFQKESNART